MTERRKFTGNERRGKAGKVFQTAEEILRQKNQAAEKLAMYESDEGVSFKSIVVNVIAIACIAIVVAGMYGLHNNTLFTGVGVVGFVVALTLGNKWVRSAKKKALERFQRDPNRHLMKHLPS